MSTPHRGLPLPGPMALSDQRPPHGMPQSQPLGYAPLPTQQHQPHQSHPQPQHPREDDRHMQDWYWAAKAEEDKRKQEEEKTRQEQIKLEQRRVEHGMLRDSMEAGVPAHLLPMIFAAISGGTGSSTALDMVKSYMQQNSQQSFQATTHMSPELRRETRTIGHPQQVIFQQTPSGNQTAAGHAVQPTSMIAAAVYPSPAYHTSPATRSEGQASRSNGFPTPASGPKPPAQVALPRLTTNEAMLPQSSSAHQSYITSHQDRASPSPSIYFHHWQPPATQNASPATREAPKTSPNQPSQLSNSSTDNSPRKRKAQGGHQPQPPPSSAPKTTSPSFSERSFSSRRNGPARQGSEQPGRGYDPVGRSNRQTSRRNSTLEESMPTTRVSPTSRVNHDPHNNRPGSARSEA